MDCSYFDIKFADNQIQFTLRDALRLQPGEIRCLPLHFITTIQEIPTVVTDFHPPVLIKPDMSFTPNFQVLDVHIANCSVDQTIIPRNTILLQFDFPHPQIVGIESDIQHILSNQALANNISNIVF